MIVFGDSAFHFAVCFCFILRFVEKADTLIKTAIAACDNGPPVPPQDLEADMAVEIQVQQLLLWCCLRCPVL